MTDQTPNHIASTPGSGQRAQRILIACASVVVILSVFVIGAGVGFGAGRLSAGGLAAGFSGSVNEGGAEPRKQLEERFSTFWEAMDVLYGNFYGDLPDGDDATYAAIRGVVRELDDPNTSFLSPDEAEVFRTNLSGSFEGIGARVEWDEEADTVRVVEPFENQPAWNSGVRRGDLILAVNGESLVGTDLTSAVQKIRGPKGSVAVLTLLRQGYNDGQPFQIEVVRDRIETPTVSTDSLGESGEIAYVRLYSFNENAGQLVRQAVSDAVQRGARALVFDLRGNTGGLLREAVKVASIFLENQVVLNERFKNGNVEVYRTEGRPVTTDLPMILLVNEGSASASEIVAGALQDAGRAQLVGTVTFGKGSVQLPQTLSDGSIMRVTIARWFTPKDRTIDGVGLTPDILVEFSDEEREAGKDPQLERALEEVTKLVVE